MADTYCTVSDLLLGDTVLQNGFDKQRYVDLAADEMNSRLGYEYVIPIESSSPSEDVGAAALLILKNINLKLASGRLILAIAAGGEETALNAYGNSLCQEAYAELSLVLSGQLPLVNASRLDNEVSVPTARTVNADKESGVDAFYEEFVGQHRPFSPFPLGGIWRPNDA